MFELGNLLMCFFSCRLISVCFSSSNSALLSTVDLRNIWHDHFASASISSKFSKSPLKTTVDTSKLTPHEEYQVSYFEEECYFAGIIADICSRWDIRLQSQGNITCLQDAAQYFLYRHLRYYRRWYGTVNSSIWHSSHAMLSPMLHDNAIWCMTTPSGAWQRHLVHDNAIWCMTMPSGAWQRHLVHDNAICCMTTPSDAWQRHLVHNNAIWCITTPSGAWQRHLVHDNAIWC